MAPLRAALLALLVAAESVGCTESTTPRGAERDPEAEVHRLGMIEIIDPWARSAVGVHDAKLFFEFRNLGEPDRLVRVRSEIAAGPALFRLVRAGEAGRSLENLSHIEIPATETPFELSEVGYYVELRGVEVPLVMGSEFSVELSFERAGTIAVPFINRFHSPKLARRIREAAKRGDLEALRALRDKAAP